MCFPPSVAEAVVNLCFPRPHSHTPPLIKVIAAEKSDTKQLVLVKFLKGNIEPNTSCGTKGLLCLQIHRSSASGRSALPLSSLLALRLPFLPNAHRTSPTQVMLQQKILKVEKEKEQFKMNIVSQHLPTLI